MLYSLDETPTLTFYMVILPHSTHDILSWHVTSHCGNLCHLQMAFTYHSLHEGVDGTLIGDHGSCSGAMRPHSTFLSIKYLDLEFSSSTYTFLICLPCQNIMHLEYSTLWQHETRKLWLKHTLQSSISFLLCHDSYPHAWQSSYLTKPFRIFQACIAYSQQEINFLTMI